jgi:glycosyltransferase involved in cell wall biosynthesis
MGAPYSRNHGIKKAKYRLIALVDDDEEWLPKKLEKQVKIFENTSESLGFVYTWAKVFNKKNNVIYKYLNEISGNPIYRLLKENFICSSSVIVRRKAIIKAGLFDEKLPSCQDWDMWLRIFKTGYNCDFVDEILTISYKHEMPSIGKSKLAKTGYKLFYRKHFFFCIKIMLFNFDFIELLKIIKNII